MIAFAQNPRWLARAVVVASLASAFAHDPAAAACNEEPAPGVDWSECQKTRLMFGSADLSNGEFVETVFSATDLSKANLAGANLTLADLSNASLAGADLSGATLEKA